MEPLWQKMKERDDRIQRQRLEEDKKRIEERQREQKANDTRRLRDLDFMEKQKEKEIRKTIHELKHF